MNLMLKRIQQMKELKSRIWVYFINRRNGTFNTDTMEYFMNRYMGLYLIQDFS